MLQHPCPDTCVCTCVGFRDYLFLSLLVPEEAHMSLSQWRLCMFVVYGLVIVHTPFGRAEVVSTPVDGATGAAEAPAVIQNPEPKAANNQGPSIPSTGAAGMDSALTLDTGTDHILSYLLGMFLYLPFSILYGLKSD